MGSGTTERISRCAISHRMASEKMNFFKNFRFWAQSTRLDELIPNMPKFLRFVPEFVAQTAREVVKNRHFQTISILGSIDATRRADSEYAKIGTIRPTGDEKMAKNRMKVAEKSVKSENFKMRRFWG